jgi:YjbE family integral membrane protein
MNWDFAIKFLTIILVNIALSGDNAIVIGCAASSLPKATRSKAILFGGILAIVLRIVLTTVATLLTDIPLVSAIGGVVLFWVAWKLLHFDVGGAETEEVNKAKTAQNFRQAILLILAADLMMSLDNVIAIAGTAQGDWRLVIIGLIFSMPLIMLAGSGISLLIDKFKWLLLVGASAITFTGARMIFEDKLIKPHFEVSEFLVYGLSLIAAISLSTIAVWYNKNRQQRLITETVPDTYPGIEPDSTK